MTQEKKMYVVFCEDDGTYWCSYNTWSEQLRKATVFQSLKYANEVHKRFDELKLKTVEVRIEVVPESQTNADRIRSMNDEELLQVLGMFVDENLFDLICNNPKRTTPCGANCVKCISEWLKQTAEVE